MASGTVVSSICQSGAARDPCILWTSASRLTTMKMTMTIHPMKAKFTTVEVLSRFPTTTTTEDSDTSTSLTLTEFLTTIQWTPSNLPSGSGPSQMETNQVCTASLHKMALDSVS